MNRKTIKLLIIAFVAVIIGIVSFYVFRPDFRFVSSNTTKNTIATSSDRLIMTFTQDIKPSLDLSENNITVDPSVFISEIRVSGNSLEFLIDRTVNTDYLTIKISSIESTEGNIITNLNKKYKVEYKNFKDLSEEEQARQISQSNSSETTYPIIKELPMITDEYIVDYRIPNERYEDINKLILTIDVIAVPNDNKAIAAENTDYMNEIRAKALQEIKNKGYAIDNYVIEYSENDYEIPLD